MMDMWNSKVFPRFIYIHWPFCSSKCDYCDFLSFTNREEFQEQYHGALFQEIKSFAFSLDHNLRRGISTIFFGGGTPSLYPLDLLEDFFKVLYDCFSFDDLHEITIEVNPKDVTKAHLTTWRALGINRLSVGVQILDDNVLQGVGRGQKIEDVLKLMDIAPKYFDNISIDLILGLPGTVDKTWWQTLKTVTSWPIKHVSVYFLTLYKNSPLHLKNQKGEVSIEKDENLILLYEETVDYLDKERFLQYEISNFSRPCFESLHNKSYWDLSPYKGFGLGASSFDGTRRFKGLRDLKAYLSWNSTFGRGIEEKYDYVEVIDPKMRRLEELMLGLRQIRGISLQHMLYSLSRDKKSDFVRRIKDLKEENLLEEKRGRVSLTLKGMMLENEVILYLF